MIENETVSFTCFVVGICLFFASGAVTTMMIYQAFVEKLMIRNQQLESDHERMVQRIERVPPEPLILSFPPVERMEAAND